MSAFYPGAGTDIIPPVLFPEIKTWWYMDRLCYLDFVDHVERALERCGFILESIDGNRRNYYSASTQQSIYYQFGATFPDAWDSLIHALLRKNTLVLCNFDIHSCGPLPPNFFTYYDHIITTNRTDRSLWKDDIYHHHKVSEIRLYDQWDAQDQTKDDILANAAAEKNIR
jgi:hypothetical protein